MEPTPPTQRKQRSITWLVVGIPVALIVWQCGGLTFKSWAFQNRIGGAVTPGMTPAEVIAGLGPPDDQELNAKGNGLLHYAGPGWLSAYVIIEDGKATGVKISSK